MSTRWHLATLASLLLAAVLAVALIVTIAGQSAKLPDYTVLERAAWREGDRAGELTIVLHGRERVVAVDWSCYTLSVVGEVLPASVPLVAPDAVPAPDARAWCRAP